MYSYTVDWKQAVLAPVLLGFLGISVILAAFFGHSLLAGFWGSAVLWIAGYLYLHRTWEQGDFISLADKYLLICRRKKTYIFHANDIKEIVYGNHIGFKIREQWFSLNCFVQCKHFQNDFVQFAVCNGIFVHASGSKGQGHGKYARLRVVKR